MLTSDAQAVSGGNDAPGWPTAEKGESEPNVEVPTALSEDVAALRTAVHEAAHLLPSQSPLDRFVHHNPLHAFEHLQFDAAVAEAADMFGTEDYWPESAYREALDRGRIQRIDLDWVLNRDPDASRVVLGKLTRALTVRACLIHPIEALDETALAWTLHETDVLVQPRSDLTVAARAGLLAEADLDAPRALSRLWLACQELRPAVPEPTSAAPERVLRLAEHLRAAGMRDTDRLVNPVLIRWYGAFLDHGIGAWLMSDRERGLWRCVLDEGIPSAGRPWMREATTLFRQAAAENWSAEKAVITALQHMGHPRTQWNAIVRRSLLVLPGWSGMFQRLTDRPDTAPTELRLPVDLTEVLALRLVLDMSAGAWFLRHATVSDDGLCAAAKTLARPAPVAVAGDPAWVLFQLCQVLGLGGQRLRGAGQAVANDIYGIWAKLDVSERRKRWHAAYEHRYRDETFAAVAAHQGNLVPAPRRTVQMAMCFDDREESLRRHLEEIAPWVETLGVAGNFNIAMYYHGLEHGEPVALGPATVVPKHLIVERPLHGEFKRRRIPGLIRHQLDRGTQTFLGGATLALSGLFAAVPMSLRILAPRLHAQWTHADIPSETTIDVDWHGEITGDLRHGFTFDEQLEIVHGTLRWMSLLGDFAPLVFCLGHGSRSMNNPHEAAHDCGACGGGRGGPNARVFARMINKPKVRAALRLRGVDIPDDTWFVGGYHNTADDEVSLYDTGLVPAPLRSLLADCRAALDKARALDALERVRKFDSVPLGLSPEEALRSVENRDEDLAQPRPEYGHCTNAIALVGRRAWSRGLFLDRRAFVLSYDPERDTDGALLADLLAMAVPVGAGINLEYWFAVVDPTGYGSGTKLPHNVSGLVGVMDGHQSDLRTGLPWQMVELHEPVRLVCVIESTPERLMKIAQDYPAVGRLIVNEWIHLGCFDPETREILVFEDGGFKPWTPNAPPLPVASDSVSWFADARGLLPPASIMGGQRHAS